MEVSLLQDAIADYQVSLQAITEGLAASPDDPELTELKEQLEGALADAEAALAGLQQDAAPAEQQQPQEPQQPAQAAAPVATAVPRSGAAAGRGNARIHPRSRYAFEQPDFAALAQLYPSLEPHLLRPGSAGGGGGASAAAAPPEEAGEPGEAPGAAGAVQQQQQAPPQRASIDFTSPAACRELTRVLLRHDFGLEWWVPLGQLVPPVTNRANYLHWIEDLLSLSAPPGRITGLDIGCGANLIYPLLGATLCGWRMVGADCTPAALAWAARNLGANAAALGGLVGVRAVAMQPDQAAFLEAAAAGAGGTGGGGGGGAAAKGGKRGKGGKQQEKEKEQGKGGDAAAADATAADKEQREAAAAAAAAAAAETAEDADAAEALALAPAVAGAQPARVLRLNAAEAAGAGIISSAVRRGERFAFCMCNPPFFESLDEAGRNPATAYGGTPAEMVYPGGELAFVSAMVQDSLALRGGVHWYSTMVGRKATLKAARSLLYRHGVRALRTTEFAQGKTSRWGLAWSFVADPSAASQPLPRFPAGGSTSVAGGGGQAAAAAAAAAPAQQLRVPTSGKLSWQVHAPPAAGPAVLAAIERCLRQAGVACTVDSATYTARGTYYPTEEERTAAAAAGADAALRGPAAKRQRAELASGSGSSWALELRLFQQHAGLFLLTAALAPPAPAGALPWFGALARRLQGALGASWRLQA